MLRDWQTQMAGTADEECLKIDAKKGDVVIVMPKVVHGVTLPSRYVRMLGMYKIALVDRAVFT